MAMAGTISNLFTDLSQLENFEDVTGDVEPFPTLVPYEEFPSNVLSYKMMQKEDVVMALLQNNTDQFARIHERETWTWVVQWQVDPPSTIQNLIGAISTAKKLRINSSDTEKEEESQNKAAKYLNFGKAPKAIKLRQAPKPIRRWFRVSMLNDEDALRSLLDIIHARSDVVPNCIEFFYRWIDILGEDGYALQCALRDEIPSLWDFEQHPYSSQEDEPKEYGPDPIQSGRLLYRERRFGLKPPRLSRDPTALFNIPTEPAQAEKYYVACYKQRQRALHLVIEAGMTREQINNYKTRQDMHPFDTSKVRGEYHLQHMSREMANHVRATLRTTGFLQLSERWNEAQRNRRLTLDVQPGASNNPCRRPALLESTASLPFRNAAFNSARAHKSGLIQKRTWFRPVDNPHPVPLPVYKYLQADYFKKSWVFKANGDAVDPRQELADAREQGVPDAELAHLINERFEGNQHGSGDDEVDSDSDSENMDPGDDNGTFEMMDAIFQDALQASNHNGQQASHPTSFQMRSQRLPFLPPGGPTPQNIHTWLSSLSTQQLIYLSFVLNNGTSGSLMSFLNANPALSGAPPQIAALPHLQFPPPAQIGWNVPSAQPVVAQQALHPQNWAPNPAVNVASHLQFPPPGPVALNAPAAQSFNGQQAPQQQLWVPVAGASAPGMTVTAPVAPAPPQLSLQIVPQAGQLALPGQQNHTSLSPAFNALSFGSNILDQRAAPTKARRFLKHPMVRTLEGLTSRETTIVPILMYFPRVVIPTDKIISPDRTDAVMLGTFDRLSGEYNFTTAIFLPVSIKESAYRRVSEGGWQLVESFPPKTNIEPRGNFPLPPSSGDPHRRAYSRLKQAFGLIIKSAYMREEALTKRWRVTRQVSPGGIRGAIWEGYAVGLNRGITMTKKHRRGGNDGVGLIYSWNELAQDENGHIWELDRPEMSEEERRIKDAIDEAISEDENRSDEDDDGVPDYDDDEDMEWNGN